MTRLTTSLKSLAFSFVFLLFGATTALPADLSVDESIDLLRKHRSKERAELIKGVLARANDHPAFRAQLIEGLAERINSYEEDYRGANEISALRELNALPVYWKMTRIS